MKKVLALFSLLFILHLPFLSSSASAQMPQTPKREFRGAWIQAVNGQWQGIGRDAMQAELTRELNILQADGINAILFQVRVEGDALYAISTERRIGGAG